MTDKLGSRKHNNESSGSIKRLSASQEGLLHVDIKNAKNTHQ